MHFLKSLAYLVGFFVVAAFARDSHDALPAKQPSKA